MPDYTKFDRKTFFDHVRARKVAGTVLKQKTVDSLEQILDAWGKYYPKADIREVAYSMATARHEAWNPSGQEIDYAIEEIGGAAKSYGQPHPVTGKRYYGRGLVQLTHYDNYARAGKACGCDLVNNPELALGKDVSAAVLVHGMVLGWFREGERGRRIGHYFTPTLEDVEGARGIINGDVEKNGPVVAGYYRHFLTALKAAEAARPRPVPKPVPMPTQEQIAAAVAAILPNFIRQITDAVMAQIEKGGSSTLAAMENTEGSNTVSDQKYGFAPAVILGPMVATIAEKVVEGLVKSPQVPVTPANAPVVRAEVEKAVAEEVRPRVEHITNNEPWYQSRVTLGALAAIIAGGAAMAGVAMDVEEVTRILIACGPILGGLLALYGRWAARKPLGA